MTDREIMQQALEALDGLSEPYDVLRIQTALRDRLAQPEHHDPIGDAQDKLIAGQAARPCKVGGPCVPTQTGPCACKELPPSIGPVVEQPQMQPCAGRNCGSTNPNLHSAECFEDYEKATGMAQPAQQEPVLETVYETIIRWDEGGGKRSRRELARRIVDLYTAPPQRKPLTDEEIEDEWERITGHSIFGGNRAEGRTMYISPDEVIEFARATSAAHGITGEKK